MSTILLEISRELQAEVMELAQALREETKPLDGGALGGRDPLIQVSVALTPASVPVLARVVIKAVRAKKHVALKLKGITVGGLREETILPILEDLSREG